MSRLLSLPVVLGAFTAMLQLPVSSVGIAYEWQTRSPAPASANEQPSHLWAAEAFLPVTADRVAAVIPAADQPAWQAYLAESGRRSKLLPNRDLVDHSSNKPLAGGPIGSSYSKGVRLNAKPDYYASEPAQTIADHVVNWQTAVGSWVKSGDYSRDRRPEDDHHDAWSTGTFDNDATIFELRYLALVAQAAGDAPKTKAWRDSFLRGLDYIFAAQYPNGGFPQIYPLVGWYHDAITFNDDALVHILDLLRDVAGRKAEFAFVPEAQAKAAKAAYERGIGCVLATQLKTPSGRLLVWGQQHDPLTLQPCAARNFEPISACSSESAGLVQFLMELPQPSPDVIRAIEGAMSWFQATEFHDVVWTRSATTGTGLAERKGAPGLWARFYELETSKPIFGDRDRSIHYAVTELSNERRLGYGWFNPRANTLPDAYAAWRKRVAAK